MGGPLALRQTNAAKSGRCVFGSPAKYNGLHGKPRNLKTSGTGFPPLNEVPSRNRPGECLRGVRDAAHDLQRKDGGIPNLSLRRLPSSKPCKKTLPWRGCDLDGLDVRPPFSGKNMIIPTQKAELTLCSGLSHPAARIRIIFSACCDSSLHVSPLYTKTSHPKASIVQAVLPLKLETMEYGGVSFEGAHCSGALSRDTRRKSDAILGGALYFKTRPCQSSKAECIRPVYEALK